MTTATKQPGQRIPSCSSIVGHRVGGWARRRTARPVTPTLSVRQAEIEQELALARDIQQGLLLEAVPRLPGWELSAVSLPARDLGGDLYDFLRLGVGQHGIMIGDVSGKGLPAALRMAVARTVFRHEARKGELPAPTLAGVNRVVLADIPQGMVTMLYTTLDLHSGVLRMANAGHNFPIVIDGDLNELEPTGLPLGVDGESAYCELVYELPYGATVFFFTDGVVEAMNVLGEMYGDDRLHHLLRSNARLKPRAMVALLLHDLRAWSGGAHSDDVTLVVVRRRYAAVGAELRLVVEDVLGSERAQALLTELALPETAAPLASWKAAAAEFVQHVQSTFGRGLARELNAQFRLVLEEYR